MTRNHCPCAPIYYVNAGAAMSKFKTYLVFQLFKKIAQAIT